MWPAHHNYVTRGLNRKFKESYRCFSIISAFPDRERLESGGKILLPPSALEKLARLEIEYPMLFQLKHKVTETGQTLKTHCGVLEFIAAEGHCFIPGWMMKQLKIKDGEIISVKSASLPLGTFVRFQPHQKAFTEISNPKAVLERELGLEVKFAALTKGDAIPIRYLDRTYFLSVLDVLPENPANAISIIETDINVDFAPALDDLQQPERKTSAPPTPIANSPISQSPVPAQPSFTAFAGSGFRLDGKASKVDSNPKLSTSPAAPSYVPSKALATTTPVNTPTNRMVFGGSNASRSTPSSSSSNSTPPQQSPAKEDPKFVPFSGQGYRLK